MKERTPPNHKTEMVFSRCGRTKNIETFPVGIFVYAYRKVRYGHIFFKPTLGTRAACGTANEVPIPVGQQRVFPSLDLFVATKLLRFRRGAAFLLALATSGTQIGPFILKKGPRRALPVGT